MTAPHEMKTQVSFEIFADHLRAKMVGAFPSEEEIYRAVQDEALKVDRSRILVDAFGVTPPFTDLDRFWAGKMIADIFGHRFKIVILIHQELITKAGENAAVNRGARLLVTSDERLALQWLLG